LVTCLVDFSAVVILAAVHLAVVLLVAVLLVAYLVVVVDGMVVLEERKCKTLLCH